MNIHDRNEEIWRLKSRISLSEYVRIIQVETWRYNHTDFKLMMLYRWRFTYRMSLIALAISILSLILNLIK